MHTDQSFQVFYANVTGKGEGPIGERTLPRKRHTPDKLKVGVLTYPFLSKITLKSFYYKGLSVIVSAINQRFN